METRVAVISIIVENPEQTPALNDLLHEYADFIVGRLGIPYRTRGVNIICIVMDAPLNKINGLTGALGRFDGITAKATFSNV